MMKSLLLLVFVFVVGILIKAAKTATAADDDDDSQWMVETLPGYNGTLPFKLETGYIGVGDDDQVQLFYYFIQSENDPNRDPLLLWLNGGPGCSALSGLVYEIGPLAFDLEHFDGSLPSFVLNPYSWTKVANIIFLDSPVGTGFSYSSTSEGYPSSDTKATQQIYTFLRKWLLSHPTFIKNRLFVAGDSYGGKIVPMVTLQIAKGNEAQLQPIMSLKGYIIGNPVTNGEDANEQIPYAHRTALISDKQFERARSSCNGEYENPDPNNVKCLFALYVINQRIKYINTAHILESICKYISPRPTDSTRFQPWLVDDPIDLLDLSNRAPLKCRVTIPPISVNYIFFLHDIIAVSHLLQNQNYVACYIWANDEIVREAL